MTTKQFFFFGAFLLLISCGESNKSIKEPLQSINKAKLDTAKNKPTEPEYKMVLDAFYGLEGVELNRTVNLYDSLNDSIKLVLLTFTGPVEYIEYIITLKHDSIPLKKLRINESYDRDLSIHEYYYLESERIEKNKFLIQEHHITGNEENEKDSILTSHWLIKADGAIEEY